MNLKHRQTCRICGNPHLVDVLDLGDQYLQGSFVKAGQPQPSTRKIPTKLVRCDVSRFQEACGAVQMSVTTSPTVLYRSYWYRSSVSQTMRDHLKGIVDQVNQTVTLRGRGDRVSSVLDIASNDGTLLGFYSDDLNKWGIDPSDIARNTGRNSTTIINDCFPTRKLDPEARFDAITTIAMFYDIDDPIDFVKHVEKHLTPEGIWIVEVAYLPATLKQVSYDTVVHEHLLYYSLASLEHVLRAAGLRAFKAELNEINGGSIKVLACKEGCFKYDSDENSEHLNKLRVDEFDMALDTEEPYESFRAKVRVQRDDLRKLIHKLRAEGRTVHLLGASTKCNTLLQYCGLDVNDIPYAAERSPEKHGAKTLGTNIRIVSEEDSRAMLKEGDAYLVGPWHFRDEIIKREEETLKRGISLIFPLPKLEVIERFVPFTV